MNNYLPSLLACIGLALAVALPAQAGEHERNAWPIRVAQKDGSNTVISWQGAGPLFFAQPLSEGRRAHGFRPFYLKKVSPLPGQVSETAFLYPLFVYRTNGEWYTWSVFNLINRNGQQTAEADAKDKGFDVWPFYFSRQTGIPESSYRALFPIAGTVKNRLFIERATWLVFPLYLQTEKRGLVSTSVPWPFIRIYRGNGNSGFALWPLFGFRGKPGVYHNQYYLWPVIYKNVSHLDRPVPTEQLGVLPFYARDRSEESVSETYVWPFFGYTDRTSPYRYHQTNYFWPFFVQGRGDERYRNRWGPFYTHSIIKGTDKTWVMWPFYRQEKWTESGLAHRKTQFLYVLYWSHQQRSASNPQLAAAEKRHIWPLYSSWDNGAGRRQFQILSPVEVWLPNSENTRLLWSPLFALYRYDQRDPHHTRTSLLFDFITWRREPTRHEFHLGPIFSTETTPKTGRIAFAGGLLGVKCSTSGGWRPFWFDFSPIRDKTSSDR